MPVVAKCQKVIFNRNIMASLVDKALYDRAFLYLLLGMVDSQGSTFHNRCWRLDRCLYTKWRNIKSQLTAQPRSFRSEIHRTHRHRKEKIHSLFVELYWPCTKPDDPLCFQSCRFAKFKTGITKSENKHYIQFHDVTNLNHRPQKHIKTFMVINTLPVKSFP